MVWVPVLRLCSGVTRRAVVVYVGAKLAEHLLHGSIDLSNVNAIVGGGQTGGGQEGNKRVNGPHRGLERSEQIGDEEEECMVGGFIGI